MSLTFGVFLCDDCTNAHRILGTNVKSLKYSGWKPDHVQVRAQAEELPLSPGGSLRLLGVGLRSFLTHPQLDVGRKGKQRGQRAIFEERSGLHGFSIKDHLFVRVFPA